MNLILILFLSFPFIGNQGMGKTKGEKQTMREEADTVIVQEIADGGIYFSEILWRVNWRKVKIEDEKGQAISKEDLEKLVPCEAEVFIKEGVTSLVTAIRILGPAPGRETERSSIER